jgi:dTDP-glucose pyrophosphorylase
MKDWKSTLVSPDTPIVDAIRTISASTLQIALVVDKDNRLLGTVTDGDVRRAILRHISIEEPVKIIMNTSPTVAGKNDDQEKIFAIMKQRDLRHIPVLDDAGRVVGLRVLTDMFDARTKDNLVVLMAGGIGERLRPLTEDCPKPMLKIGGRPVLATILESLVKFGFQKFYIAVNYKAEMIKEYFKDGARWGVDIQYLHEEEQMGTAGALSLLPKKPEREFIVMNADLLTNVNFQQLLDFHREHKVHATMAVREYGIHLPYGVVRIEDDHLVGLDEKPVQKFFVNAGIYVLEPPVMDFVPSNRFFNITDLFENLIERKLKVTTFPIREYWLDIGKVDDFHRANGEYDEHFKGS